MHFLILYIKKNQQNVLIKIQ